MREKSRFPSPAHALLVSLLQISKPNAAAAAASSCLAPISLVSFYKLIQQKAQPVLNLSIELELPLKLTSMSMLEIRVPNLDCQGCASKLKKALLKLKGVEEVEVEMEIQKITVRGYRLEEKKVVKAIRRAGKAAEPWPFPAGHAHVSSFYKYPSHIVSHYYDTTHLSSNAALHTFFHTPAVYSVAVASDEAVASLFSDDNPHACSIM